MALAEFVSDYYQARARPGIRARWSRRFEAAARERDDGTISRTDASRVARILNVAQAAALDAIAPRTV